MATFITFGEKTSSAIFFLASLFFVSGNSITNPVSVFLIFDFEQPEKIARNINKKQIFSFIPLIFIPIEY
jgi:hypothetical protein